MKKFFKRYWHWIVNGLVISWICGSFVGDRFVSIKYWQFWVLLVWTAILGALERTKEE